MKEKNKKKKKKQNQQKLAKSYQQGKEYFEEVEHNLPNMVEQDNFINKRQ